MGIAFAVQHNEYWCILRLLIPAAFFDSESLLPDNARATAPLLPHSASMVCKVPPAPTLVGYAQSVSGQV